MQVILKAANEGKTQEAIKAAYLAAQHNKVLIVSSEETAESLQRKVERFAIENPAFENRYDIVTTEDIATPEMFSDPSFFNEFGTIVLDVNCGLSRGPWITVCADLEEYGYELVVTQQLVKPVQVRQYH